MVIKQAVAVQVSINYLRPTVEGDVLIAEANTVSDGKTLALCSVAVKKEKKDVALFSGAIRSLMFIVTVNNTYVLLEFSFIHGHLEQENSAPGDQRSAQMT